MRGWRPPAIAVDSALAFVLTVLYLPGAMDDEPTAVVVPLALAQTLPLTFRRVRPVSVLALTLVAGIVFNVGFADSPTLPIGVVVSLYTVAAYCERTVSTRAALLTGATLPLPLLIAAAAADRGGRRDGLGTARARGRGGGGVTRGEPGDGAGVARRARGEGGAAR